MLLVLNVDTHHHHHPPTCLWHEELGSFVPPDSTIETRELLIPPVHSSTNMLTDGIIGFTKGYLNIVNFVYSSILDFYVCSILKCLESVTE